MSIFNIYNIYMSIYTSTYLQYLELDPLLVVELRGVPGQGWRHQGRGHVVADHRAHLDTSQCSAVNNGHYNVNGNGKLLRYGQFYGVGWVSYSLPHILKDS